jgi:hypothetical protein
MAVMVPERLLWIERLLNINEVAAKRGIVSLGIWLLPELEFGDVAVCRRTKVGAPKLKLTDAQKAESKVYRKSDEHKWLSETAAGQLVDFIATTGETPEEFGIILISEKLRPTNIGRLQSALHEAWHLLVDYGDHRDEQMASAFQLFALEFLFGDDRGAEIYVEFHPWEFPEIDLKSKGRIERPLDARIADLERRIKP